jgi:two-component system KDP operon response regulator KdpE
MEQAENKRVLIVDDDPMIRHILQTILEAEGYSVQLAENGADGVEVLHKDGIAVPFRFMVLDMMMPKMTGIEVLAALRDQPAFEKLPIIMLTAENKPTDILSGYSAGASYYMTKPFTREQLLRGIELVLAES